MYNERRAELIVCKNKHDGERLYNKIVDITKGRSKNLLYAGRYKDHLNDTRIRAGKRSMLGVSERIIYQKYYLLIRFSNVNSEVFIMANIISMVLYPLILHIFFSLSCISSA